MEEIPGSSLTKGGFGVRFSLFVVKRMVSPFIKIKIKSYMGKNTTILKWQ